MRTPLTTLIACVAVPLLLSFIQSVVRGQDFEVVHAFSYPDGASPSGGLLLATDGNFYGTTAGGGTNGNFGTVFRMTSEGAVTSLVSFNNTNGARPTAGLVQGSDGYFYGTTVYGGSDDAGTIFKLATNGALTSLLSFSNSANPYGGLVQGKDGEFYGTTHWGGQEGNGSVFKVTAEGTLTTVVSFEFNDPRGMHPRAGLTLARDGNFYGTATLGGSNNYGAIFKLATNGVVTGIHSFDWNDGFSPACRLLEAQDGNLYGMAGGGVLFKVSSEGYFMVLAHHGYSTLPLDASLLEARDGNFYGTTVGGNPSVDYGTVFKSTRDGAATTLLSLYFGSYQWPRDPSSGLIVGRNGDFYGTTGAGGVNNQGTIYRLNMPILTCITSETNIILSWSTKVSNFTLQATEDTNSPPLWYDVTHSPPVVGSEYRVTNALSFGNRFYRLKR